MVRRKGRRSVQAEDAYDSLFDGLPTSLTNEFGSDIATAREVRQAIGGRTGVVSIDAALGGGLPSGITEISGKDSVGKTALIGRVIAEAQLHGVATALVNGDYLDVPYLKNLGVRDDELLILPGNDDELEELVKGFLKSEKKVLLAIDVLNGLRPEDDEPGAWNEHVLHLLDMVRSNLSVGSLAVVTTQVRTKTSADPKKLFISGTVSSAERFSDFFDTRIELSRLNVGDYLYTMGVDIKKSALGSPARYLEVPATKGHGIEVELDFILAAKSIGVVELRGPRMFFGDRFLGMGARGAAQALMRDPYLGDEIFREMKKSDGRGE